MHGVISLTSFGEAGVEVHGNEVTFVVQTDGGMLYGMPMVKMGQYYDTS